MVAVTQRCRKTSVRFNSQQSSIASLLEHYQIKTSKWADTQFFFFQRLNFVPRSYIILDRTHSFHGILGDPPENLQKLSLYEKFYHPGNQTKKPVFYAVNAWKPLSILERIWLNHHFIFKKKKRLDTSLRKLNQESSLVANMVFYKLKTKASGIRNHSFPHFCLDSNVRHFYLRDHKCQFDIKRDSLSMEVAPRFHISKYFSMRHHQAETQLFSLVFYLYGRLL